MTKRAARRILRLVQELHIRGCQRLRIAPSMAPSGMYWRCTITPVSNILRSHGAMIATESTELRARYSSAHGRNCFGWSDAARATPSQLAELFIQRFPALVEAGRGSDWTYVGWYVEMLHLTYPNAFPIAFADWETPSDCLTTVGTREELQIPLPPPGEAPRK